MGNGRGRLGATFELIAVRRADVRRETAICGEKLLAPFVLQLCAVRRAVCALRGVPFGHDHVVIARFARSPPKAAWGRCAKPLILGSPERGAVMSVASD